MLQEYKFLFTITLTNIFLFLACCWLPSQAFSSFANTGGNIHAQITKDGLYDTVSPDNLKLIIESVESQDKPGSEALQTACRHFGDQRFTSSCGFINRQFKLALHYACESDTDSVSRGEALKHFGEMLHTAQDFYSRTNYVELMLEIPAYKTNPYAIPVVNWQEVPNGYPGLTCYRKQVSQEKTNENDLILKDNPDCPQSKRLITAEITYFQVAKDLAVRETQRQWSLLEAMIRNRCPERAAACLAALKQASP